jgi:hypothetical protein
LSAKATATSGLHAPQDPPVAIDIVAGETSRERAQSDSVGRLKRNIDLILARRWPFITLRLHNLR